MLFSNKVLLTGKVNYERIVGKIDDDIFRNIQQSVEILKETKISYTFRTTIIPHIHQEKQIFDLQNSFKNHMFALQKYRETDTIDKYFEMKSNENNH